MTRAQRPSINAREYADRAALGQMIEEDLGSTRVGHRYRCPFHEDHKPDLDYSRKLNRYRCFACGAKGDALDWLTEYRRMTFQQALAYLGAPVGIEAPRYVRPVPPPLTDRADVPVDERPAHPDPAWQEAVGRIIRRAQADYWSEAGAPTREWAVWRGLDDSTARALGLGAILHHDKIGPFDVLRDRDGDPIISLAPGLLFPTVAPGSGFLCGPGTVWAGGVIRRLNPDPFDPAPFSWGGKCLAFKGTDRSVLYPHPVIEDTQLPATALVVEGEIDAALAWQDLGHHLVVVTVGGANGKISSHAVEQLGRCRQVLIATDVDEAGLKALRRWKDFLPDRVLARAAPVPIGKDVGDFRQKHGGDLPAWIASALKQLGWPLYPAPFGFKRSGHYRHADADLGDPQTGMGDAYEGDLPGDLTRLIDRRTKP